MLVVVLLAAVFAAASQAPHAKRLILKNGDYQLATQWEQHGDRVRYYSSEREVWEELPSSLVDWAATEQYAKDQAAGHTADQQRAATEDAADRAELDARSPEVAPGLRVPESGGVFLLDEFAQKQQLAELVQAGGEINKQTGKNILRAAINPVATSKQSIELHGQHARIQAHTTPSIFINVDTGDDSDSDKPASAQKDTDRIPDRFRIVRAKLNAKRDTRIIANLKILFIGKVKQEGEFIPATSQTMAGGWLRLTPMQPLAPGEYAIIEMLSHKEMNLFVWDFGVDPAAPANPGSWQPAPEKPLPAGTNDSPYLNNRSHPK